AVFRITRFSSPDCTEGTPFRLAEISAVWHSLLDCTNVVGCGLPPVCTRSQVFSANETRAAETWGLRSRKKAISSWPNSSMHSAEELRASEYTVFFIVSVGRILTLSPSTKQDSKSPSSRISTLHSRRSCRSGCRFTFTTRTRALPSLCSASIPIGSVSSVRRITMRAQEQRNVKLRFALAHLKRNFNNRIQSLGLVGVLIAHRIKGYPVKPRAKHFALRQQLTAPTVGIRARRMQQGPLARRLSPLQ